MRAWLTVVPMVLALASPVYAACSRESAPEIPDGGTATKEAMLAAKGALTTYLASGDAYLACMQKDIDATTARGDMEAEAKNAAIAELTTQYNGAVDEMQATGDKFNAAVRAYKAAQPQ